MNILGYNSYYQVLNAKDYGIPQNRERVYTISIRKDIDNCKFEFPQKEGLKLRLKDLLENEVDEKYYLKDYQIENIKKSNFMVNKRRIQDKDYCDTLCARDWKDPKCVQVGTLDIKGNDCIKRIYSDKGISPTLTDMQGGNRQPKILELPCIGASRGRNPNNPSDRTPKINIIGNYMPSGHDASRIVNSNGLAPTVKENHGTVTATNENFRIRKLTPKECWRLMGFSDEDFEKAEKIPTSNTQLYKEAGNSICVPVLERIFRQLFK